MKIATLLLLAVTAAVAQADDVPARRLRTAPKAPKMEGDHYKHWWDPKMEAARMNSMPTNAKMEGDHKHWWDPKMEAARMNSMPTNAKMPTMMEGQHHNVAKPHPKPKMEGKYYKFHDHDWPKMEGQHHNVAKAQPKPKMESELFRSRNEWPKMEGQHHA